MILLYWKDLLIKSRIKEFAQARSIELKFARNLEEVSATVGAGQVKRLIVDLSAGPAFAQQFAGIVGAEFESIGVVAHVDLETEKAAIAAGFTQVIPRSALVKNLDGHLQSDVD
jgi:hypothetical protein